MSAEQAVAAILTGDSAPLGAVVGVARPSVTRTAAAGVANSSGEPMTARTVFDVASVTKVAATTTALLRLVSLDQLRFDDPLARFLPGTGCAPGTTVRHLLQHRAGLWEWQPLYLDPRDPADQIDALELRYPFDDGRHYSDLGFMLLGRIIAAVAGMRLDAAIRELVTAPLSLEHTGYGPIGPAAAASSKGDATERRMVATGVPYPVLTDQRDFPWREDEIVGVVNDGNCFHAFGGISGHAGLFSTAGDLLALGAALASPERHTDLWHPDAVDDMFRDGLDAGQALGWRSDRVVIDGRERRMLWHPGFTGCALGIIPESETAVALLSNRLFAAAPATTETLWRAALPALLGDETPRTIEGTRTS
ncbi:serine hydrolase domain-containing protein [Microbacterium profundi]|uniref:Serine hydrolase domain-containing protein n=1 Tax=Microbacterium profundi TaxID=450380 RepID=A0ABV3LEL9_9MICO